MIPLRAFRFQPLNLSPAINFISDLSDRLQKGNGKYEQEGILKKWWGWCFFM